MVHIKPLWNSKDFQRQMTWCEDHQEFHTAYPSLRTSLTWILAKKQYKQDYNLELNSTYFSLHSVYSSYKICISITPLRRPSWTSLAAQQRVHRKTCCGELLLSFHHPWNWCSKHWAASSVKWFGTCHSSLAMVTSIWYSVPYCLKEIKYLYAGWREMLHFIYMYTHRQPDNI